LTHVHNQTPKAGCIKKRIIVAHVELVQILSLSL
jgi:hypothetical protein